MKLQEIIFKKPVKIVQIFRNINVYGKAKKSFDDRRDEMTWRDIPSKSGYVTDNELYLPEKILDNADFKRCGLITIEDDNLSPTFSSPDLRFTTVIKGGFETIYNHCFHLNQRAKVGIFEIRNNDGLELFLQYDYYEIGIPERENFKLCDLKQNSPVEIKINGKTDFSMSSGRERVFKEQYYICEYLGDFEKCNLLREPYAPIIKQVPHNRKVADLLKPLW